MTLRTDNRLADAPMTAVRCQQCMAQVTVRKSTWSQTTVQWNGQSMAMCTERRSAKPLAHRAGHDIFLACSALKYSIDEAVRCGQIETVDELRPAH